jgi:hypothetical protein
MADASRERFLGNGAVDSPVAVLERMNGLEIKMRSCPRQGGKRLAARRRRAIEPGHEASLLVHGMMAGLGNALSAQAAGRNYFHRLVAPLG